MTTPHFSDDARTKSMVYIIDDDPEVRRSMAALLSASGLDCQCFVSAIAFLRDRRDDGPACIVTDVRMPEMSGLQLLERMQATGIGHPVIVMTGYSEVDTVIRAFRNGAVDVFEKPVAGSLLLERVQSAIERDRRARTRRAKAASFREQLAKLSSRERQVMGLLVEGRSNKEIAWQLNVSDKTVSAHRSNLLSKLQLESLAQLVTQVASCESQDLLSGPARDSSVAAA